MSSSESLSLEETNKIRATLGLAPLADGSSANADGGATEPTEEEIAVQNYREKKAAEDKAKEEAELKQRIDKARNKRELNAKLAGKTLADIDDEGAKSWVKRTKKKAKSLAAELAKKRQQELEEMDKELAQRYDENDLAGLKVGHDVDAFEAEETILTLKDSRLLDDEDDELINVNLAEQERTDERIDLKKKGKQLGQYTGYDDEEFSTGKKRGVLSKYDADIGDAPEASTGFVLGSSRPSGPTEEASSFQATAQPVLKTSEARQEVARELKKTLDNVVYSKNLDVSDYVQEGEAGFKKPKKKKNKNKGAARKKGDDEEETTGMDVDVPIQRTSAQELDRQALLDDEDLQAALARQRRQKNRKALSALKRVAEQESASPSSMDYDSPVPDDGRGMDDLPEVKAEEEEGGLVLDDTSEFVRNISLQTAIPKREPKPAPAAVEPITEMDVDANTATLEAAAAMNEDPYEVEEEKPPIAPVEHDPIAEGTAGEVLVSQGLSATMTLLRQQGLVKEMTPEERERDRLYKERQAFLAARREDQLRAQELKSKGKGAAAAKDQKQRELENKARDREQAQRDLARFKDYKPNVEINYKDEFGRDMTQKEAWKDLSHRFHGKGSGIKMQEKRLKKIADEKRRAAMAAGDTPLSTNAAFQARQEKLGTATMVLSVGNKMTAPGLEEFQTTGSSTLNVSKASKRKQQEQQSQDINLTPSLVAPPQQPMPAAEAMPVPRKAGFQRISKRTGDAPSAEPDSKRPRTES